jgi:hypothetical protein
MPATRRIKKRGGTKRKMRGGNTRAFLTSYLKGRGEYSDRAIEEGVKAGVFANQTARNQLLRVGQQPKGFDLSSKTSKIVQNVAKKVANEVKQREDIARQTEAARAAEEAAARAAAEAAEEKRLKNSAANAIRRRNAVKNNRNTQRYKKSNAGNLTKIIPELEVELTQLTDELTQLQTNRNEFSKIKRNQNAKKQKQRSFFGRFFPSPKVPQNEVPPININKSISNIDTNIKEINKRIGKIKSELTGYKTGHRYTGTNRSKAETNKLDSLFRVRAPSSSGTDLTVGDYGINNNGIDIDNGNGNGNGNGYSGIKMNYPF